MKGSYNEVPLEELTTPKEGYVCMLNRYWLQGPNGGALSWDVPRLAGRSDRYPQCNSNVRIVERWSKTREAELSGYVFVPVAYWPRGRE